MYLKQILHTNVFNILNIVTGFVTIFVMVRYLATAEYGEYVLIQGFIAVAGMVFSQNLFTYTRMHIPGAETRVQYSYVKSVLMIVFACYAAVVATAKVLNVEGYIWGFVGLSPRLEPFILVMLGFELLNMELMRYFIAVKKIQQKNYAQFLQKVFVLLGTLALVATGNLGLQEFLSVFICGQLVVFAFSARFIDLKLFVAADFIQDVFRRGYAVALPLLPVGLMSIALNYTDTLMISKFIDKEHTAQYGFASQIISITMMMIGTSIVLTLFPYATHAHNEKDAELRTAFFVKMYLYGVSAALAFYILSSVNARLAIQVLNLKGYQDVPQYLSVLALFPLFQLIYNVSSHHLQLMQVFRAQVVIALAVIIANIVLNYFLIQAYGVMGAAFASLLAFIILCSSYLVFSCRHDAALFRAFTKSIKVRTLLPVLFLAGIGAAFSWLSLNRNTGAVLLFDSLVVVSIAIAANKKFRLAT